MLRLVHDDPDNDSSRSPITEVLMGLHDSWLSRLRQSVARILAVDTSLMERWGVLREFDAELDEWYRSEVALARDLAPTFPAGAEHRLARAEQAIARVRAEIRTIAPAPESMAPLREAVLDLLDALQLWCVELELAVTDLAVSQRGSDGCTIFQRLDAASQRREGRS